MSKVNAITVICPTYNSANYITGAIDSILHQIDFPEEVIFSDDGSVDTTPDIIESHRVRFEKHGIRLLVIRNTHQGPGASRNQALDNATFPWVAFLDSDDIWEKEKVARVREMINSPKGYNFIQHWESYKKLGGGTQVLMNGSTYNSKASLAKQLYKTNFFSTSATVCKKELIHNVGNFDVTLPNSQDYDLWLKMSSSIRLGVIPEVLGNYIEIQTSISARPYYRKIFSNFRIALRHRDKGGYLLMLWKIVRLFLSKAWYHTVINLISGSRRH
jgi:glycosyltransferase involved in cell wall biosynthesis